MQELRAWRAALPDDDSLPVAGTFEMLIKICAAQNRAIDELAHRVDALETNSPAPPRG